MLKKFRKNGQNVAEYAILIGLVIAAAIGMQLYVKRGLQSRVKGGMEYFFNQTINIADSVYCRQYEPPTVNSVYSVVQTSNTDIKLGGGYTNAAYTTNVLRYGGGYTDTGGNLAQPMYQGQ